MRRKIASRNLPRADTRFKSKSCRCSFFYSILLLFNFVFARSNSTFSRSASPTSASSRMAESLLFCCSPLLAPLALARASFLPATPKDLTESYRAGQDGIVQTPFAGGGAIGFCPFGKRNGSLLESKTGISCMLSHAAAGPCCDADHSLCCGSFCVGLLLLFFLFVEHSQQEPALIKITRNVQSCGQWLGVVGMRTV